MGTAVVVATGALACAHGGTVVVTSAMTSSRLTVGRHGVLLVGGEANISFASGTPPCNNTVSGSSALAPCTTRAATSGTSTRLRVGTVGVVLGAANGTTTPSATPATIPPPLTWKVDSTANSRLTSA